MAPEAEANPMNDADNATPLAPASRDMTFSDVRGEMENVLRGARTALSLELKRVAADMSADGAAIRAALTAGKEGLEEIFDAVQRGKMSQRNFVNTQQRIMETVQTKLLAIKNAVLRRAASQYLSSVFRMVLGVAAGFAGGLSNLATKGIDSLLEKLGG